MLLHGLQAQFPGQFEQGIAEYANPTSILKAEALLLRHICRPDAAQKLENALSSCPCGVTGDKDGETCRVFVDRLLSVLN